VEKHETFKVTLKLVRVLTRVVARLSVNYAYWLLHLNCIVSYSLISFSYIDYIVSEIYQELFSVCI
jgi:hypothetical protein